MRRAALALDRTESGISRRIRDLEEELGVSLLNRSPRGVVLTHAGRIFLDHARRMLSELERGVAAAGQCGRGQQGKIRIGLTASVVSGFFAQLLRCFSKAHVGVRIDYVEGTVADHVRAIRHQEIDVAFFYGRISADPCEWIGLWNEAIFVALPASHHLADHDVLEWSDLSGCRFLAGDDEEGKRIRECISSGFSSLGRPPELECHAVRHATLVPLSLIGGGVLLASDTVAQMRYPGIVFRLLAEEQVPFGAMWSNDNDNPAFRRLLSLARSRPGKCSECPFKRDSMGTSTTSSCPLRPLSA